MEESILFLIRNRSRVEHLLGRSHFETQAQNHRESLIKSVSLLAQTFNVSSKQNIKDVPMINLPTMSSACRNGLRALGEKVKEWMPDGVEIEEAGGKSMDELVLSVENLSFANFVMTPDYTKSDDMVCCYSCLIHHSN